MSLVGAALLLTACGQTDPAGGGGDDLAWSDLDGRTFLSTGVTKDGEPYPLVNGSVIRLTFGDDGISATGGCNTMGGTASLDGDVLVIDGPLAMTEMACDEPLMRQDTWLADLLADRPALTLAADELSLRTDTYTVQLLDEETADPDRALEGTKWSVTGLVTGTGPDGAVSSIPAGILATVQLEGGTLRASSGCNRMQASYTVDGDTLTVSELASTKMACPGPEDEVEMHMKQVLDGAVTFEIDGPQLSLVNGDRALQLTASD